MENLINNFYSFKIQIKKFEEGKSFDESISQTVNFDIKDIGDINLMHREAVLEKRTEIIKKLFLFRNIYELQKHNVQIIEDEFLIWRARHYNSISNERSKRSGQVIPRTISQIESKINAMPECVAYLQKIGVEKYNLGLLYNTVRALENFDFKLHDSLEYSHKKIY